MPDDARNDPPPPAGFQELLFARADAEDIARYRPGDLDALAAAAYAHLAEPRLPGHVEIRLIDHVVAGAAGPREITVLEVINDNMPFLLDSTLAEIAEQGIEPVLVAHPILVVERGADGALLSLPGAPTAAAQRESFLHIHFDRIDDAAARERLVAGLALVHADVRVAVADWVPMRTRVYERYAGHAGSARRRCPRRKSPRRSRSWTGSTRRILPSSACANTAFPKATRRPIPCRAPASDCCATRT